MLDPLHAITARPQWTDYETRGIGGISLLEKKKRIKPPPKPILAGTLMFVILADMILKGGLMTNMTN